VFLSAAVAAQAEAMQMQRGWWQEIQKKYKLPTNQPVFIDFNTYDFYIQKEDK
jgi:hypothetical protein